jgi:hypothetical protein
VSLGKNIDFSEDFGMDYLDHKEENGLGGIGLHPFHYLWVNRSCRGSEESEDIL